MSAPDNLDPNESTCDSEEFALDLLRDAADSARALLANLPDANAQALSKHSIVAMAYALLVHLDARAEEQYAQGRAIIEGLRAISESVNLLAVKGSGDDTHAKPQPASTQAMSDYARLEELLMFAQSTFGDADYREALTRLRRLAGV